MSADRKEDDFMSEITITATKAMTAPQYGKTAAGLLAACRRFWENPENEAEFQKWKKGGRKSDHFPGGVRAGVVGGDHDNGDPERTAG